MMLTFIKKRDRKSSVIAMAKVPLFKRLLQRQEAELWLQTSQRYRGKTKILTMTSSKNGYDMTNLTITTIFSQVYFLEHAPFHRAYH